MPCGKSNPKHSGSSKHHCSPNFHQNSKARDGRAKLQVEPVKGPGRILSRNAAKPRKPRKCKTCSVPPLVTQVLDANIGVEDFVLAEPVPSASLGLVRLPTPWTRSLGVPQGVPRRFPPKCRNLSAMFESYHKNHQTLHRTLRKSHRFGPEANLHL